MSDELFETQLFEETKVGFQQPLVIDDTEQAVTHVGEWMERAVIVRLLNKLVDYAKAHKTMFCVIPVEIMSNANSPDEARKIVMVASNLFRAQLRGSDTLLQYGPKKLCIILPHADAKRGQKVIARLRSAAARTAMTGPHNETVEPVFGISSEISGSQAAGENMLTHAEVSLKNAIEMYLLQPR